MPLAPPRRPRQTKPASKKHQFKGKMEAFATRQADTFLAKVNEGYVTNEQIERLQQLIKGDPSIRRILEIGFNGGNSAAAMLSVRDDVEVVSFDIGTHSYIKRAKELIDDIFPARHTLILGNSKDTLPKYYDTYKKPVFDAAFIDGCHERDMPFLDIQNSCKLVKKNGLIIVDDIIYPDVETAVKKAKAESLLRATRHPTLTDRSWSECRRV